jgi:hypothetical protein
MDLEVRASSSRSSVFLFSTFAQSFGRPSADSRTEYKATGTRPRADPLLVVRARAPPVFTPSIKMTVGVRATRPTPATMFYLAPNRKPGRRWSDRQHPREGRGHLRRHSACTAAIAMVTQATIRGKNSSVIPSSPTARFWLVPRVGRIAPVTGCSREGALPPTRGTPSSDSSIQETVRALVRWKEKAKWPTTLKK